MRGRDVSDLAAIRRDYRLAGLELVDTDPDPVVQFTRWMADAETADIGDRTAMTLATAEADGSPDARIVLLKRADAAGLVFFGDRRSTKGRQLRENPRAALCFWWSELERQVRVAGTVALVSEEESATYFASRPRDSQLSAWASVQSAVVPDRAALDAAWPETARRFADTEIPLPPHWGGFRLVPERFEFWQGRAGRFHDRIVYRRAEDGAWFRERLSP
jgi:pyridoxamine 5'-phosphate oxidase